MSEKNKKNVSKNRQKRRVKKTKVDINFFKTKMENINHWSEYDVSDFSAPYNGDAYKIANAFKTESGKSNKNKSTQLRRFYNAALKGRTILDQQANEGINEVLVILLMIVPRVHYAFKRNLITKTVNEFFTIALDKSKFRTENIESFTQDYDRFMKFFESVIGYNYFLKG